MIKCLKKRGRHLTLLFLAMDIPVGQSTDHGGAVTIYFTGAPSPEPQNQTLSQKSPLDSPEYWDKSWDTSSTMGLMVPCYCLQKDTEEK